MSDTDFRLKLGSILWNEMVKGDLNPKEFEDAFSLLRLDSNEFTCLELEAYRHGLFQGYHIRGLEDSVFYGNPFYMSWMNVLDWSYVKTCRIVAKQNAVDNRRWNFPKKEDECIPMT